LLGTLRLLVAALALPCLAGDSAYEREILRWRAAHEAEIKADDGWLTVSGLFWLRPGRNTFGSGPDNDIVLPRGSAAARVGVFVFDGHRVRVLMEPGAGMPAREALLKSDRGGQPDLLHLGDVTLYLIERGGRYAIRMKDRNSVLRRNFQGLRWYPVKPAWRVEARFVPYDTPKSLRVATAVGGEEAYTCPGYVVFRLQGRELQLHPVLESPDSKQLLFIFRDRTSGKETYPAGRFLYTDLPVRGRVTLDFNRAENPPCAFTPYATCPLPPRENRLPVFVRAGERDSAHHVTSGAARARYP
jgi:uncharacterized protein (DUF1684 family)